MQLVAATLAGLLAQGAIPVFAPPLTSPAGSSPSSVFAARLDRDGDLDLAVTDSGAASVAALLGNGAGSFPTLLPNPVGSKPSSVLADDFNGDGNQDLAATNEGAGNVTILLGNGDGTFRSGGGPFAVGASPVGAVTGDFNGDDVDDLAVANNGSDNVSILLGDGTGFFRATFSPAAGVSPTSIDTGDFTGDGVLDLVVANPQPGGVTLLLGNGDGTFQQPGSTYSAESGSQALAATDLNDDARPDVAVANHDADDVSILLNSGSGVLTNAGDVPVATPVQGGSGPDDVEAGDFNGDGHVDLATANEATDNVAILLGDGSGAFTPATSASVGDSPQWLALADYNGDDKLDIASANQGDGTVSVLLNTTAFPAPRAVTQRAVGVRASSATLVGLVHGSAHTNRYFFEYGRTRRYGRRTATRSVPRDDDARVVRTRVTGLRPGVRYRYRLIATSRSGRSVGRERIVRTRPMSR